MTLPALPSQIPMQLYSWAKRSNNFIETKCLAEAHKLDSINRISHPQLTVQYYVFIFILYTWKKYRNNNWLSYMSHIENTYKIQANQYKIIYKHTLINIYKPQWFLGDFYQIHFKFWKKEKFIYKYKFIYTNDNW